MHWAQPVIPRAQLQLFSVHLEELLPPDDEMRVFDALLQQLDWSAWEASYERRTGQPPLHPRVVAGVILFGLLKGLRSSRQLEEATVRRIDVMWFVEGRRIDHATFCGFRRRFESQLAELFVQVARAANRGIAGAGRRAGVDGTSLRAHSDRHGSRTAASLTERLEELAQKRTQLLGELEQRDCLESAAALLSDGSAGTRQLREQLEAIQAQQAKLAKALEVARQRDAQKQANDGPKATPVRVPVHDPESTLLPNKEGGFAPNWTPTAAVDLASGVIIDARVVEGAEETAALVPAVEALRQLNGGQPVEALLADGRFTAGASLKDLDERGVPLYAPSPPLVHPAAVRPDLHVPVGEAQAKELPLAGSKDSRHFSREAFVYDAQTDCYYCPQGRALQRTRSETRHGKDGRPIERWRYSCPDCGGCPLAGRCLSGKAQSRTVIRDQHQPYRDQLAQRMSTPEAQQLYRKRAPVVEGVFGYIKHAMGIRRFFHCGRHAVQREWRWVCMAFNLGKLLRRTRAGSEGKQSANTRQEANAITGAKIRLCRALGALWTCKTTHTQKHALAA